MFSEKCSAKAGETGKASEGQTPCSVGSEMMAKMMALCGCRPEQMGEDWARCCEMFFGKAEPTEKA